MRAGGKRNGRTRIESLKWPENLRNEPFRGAEQRHVIREETLLAKARMVKIFMRRGCSTGVGRKGVLDSGCHVADRAQAEQGRGRAARCSCLDGCVLRDNALGTG